MTIGSNFSTKTVDLPDHPEFNVKLQIWDLAGQKHFSFVRPPFYRGSTASVYTFDLSRRSSFSNLIEWQDEAEKVIGPKPCILVGNKLDLANEGQREVSTQEGEAAMIELGAFKYIEISAKEGDYVEGVFTDLTLAILKASGKL